MALDVIVTSSKIDQDPAARGFIDYVRDNAQAMGLSSSVMYYEFPAFTDYESNSHRADILILSPSHGIIAIRFAVNQNTSQILGIDQSLIDFSSNIYSRLLRSRELRSSVRELKFSVYPLIFLHDVQLNIQADAEVCGSYAGFSELRRGQHAPLLRYENAPRQYVEEAHPTSHFHFGHHPENRWAVDRTLTPSAFTTLIVKQFYGDVWFHTRHRDPQTGLSSLEDLLRREKQDCPMVPVEQFSAAERRQFFFG